MCCWIRKVSKNKQTRKQEDKKTSSPSPLPLPRREGSDYRDTPRILQTRNRWFKRKRGVNSKLSFYKNIKQSNKLICCSVFFDFITSNLSTRLTCLLVYSSTRQLRNTKTILLFIIEPSRTTNFSNCTNPLILWTLNFELWTLWFVF